MYHPRHNDTLLFGGIIAFLFGVLLRSFFSISPILYCFIVVSAFLFYVFLVKTHRVYALFVLLFVSLFIFGSLRFEIREFIQTQTIEHFEITNKYYGTIIEEPTKEKNYQKFIVRVHNTEGIVKILATTDRYPEVSFGDFVSIEGRLVSPKNFIASTGREFQYEKYLLKNNIFFLMPYAEVSIMEEGDMKGLRHVLFFGKQKFIDAIHRVIPDPESALLGGILLGVDNTLGKDLEQKFINTGTIHIVVLSGYNVTIVSEAIVKIMEALFPKNIALSFGGFGIVLFALLSGLSTTTVRASIMGLLGLLARVTKRNYDIFRAICVTAFVMVLINPFTLSYDISFQLSFIATLGLVLVTPIVETWKFVQYMPKRFGLREVLSSSFAVQITVLPFILYSMGTLSIIAPLANMLILPLIPLSMGLGFLSGFVELVSGLGSNPISWLSFGVLHYIVQVVSLLSSFSWSAFMVQMFPLGVTLTLYFLIVVWVYKKRNLIWKN